MYHWCITCNTDVSWTTSVIHPYLGWYSTWYMYHARWMWYTVSRMIQYMIHVSCKVNVIHRISDDTLHDTCIMRGECDTVHRTSDDTLHDTCIMRGECDTHRTSDDTLGITTWYIYYTCINALNDDTCISKYDTHMIHIWYVLYMYRQWELHNASVATMIRQWYVAIRCISSSQSMSQLLQPGNATIRYHKCISRVSGSVSSPHSQQPGRRHLHSPMHASFCSLVTSRYILYTYL